MEVDPYDDPALYTIQPIPCMKRFKKIFRLVDMYALPITLRYKQEKRFYTNWGACTSVALIVVMLGFFLSYLLKMLADTETTETVFTKLIKNKDSTQFGTGNFMFGFRIRDSQNEPFWEEDVIEWSILTTEKEWDSETNSYSED